MDTNGTTDDNPVTPGNDLKRRARETYNDYLTKGLVMKSWAVSEQSILVYCQTYSRICLAIASIIVFGSLSVPFLVGKRIQGVDPFQFVTFAWLLAGAFLVGAKGHYVTDWPWHDFLSGQVLCRSVSELADFCALNPQVVLFYLLHNEVRNPLVFRGPFVEPFAKRGESGTGFNVDVPLKHSTALGMGFVVLKVVWKDEEYLLIVDGRDEPVRDGRDVYASLEGNQSCSIKNKEIKPRNEEVTKLKRKEWKARNEGRGLYRVLGQYCNERKFG
jgi:hypothetical protein